MLETNSNRFSTIRLFCVFECSKFFSGGIDFMYLFQFLQTKTQFLVYPIVINRIINNIWFEFSTFKIFWFNGILHTIHIYICMYNIREDLLKYTNGSYILCCVYYTHVYITRYFIYFPVYRLGRRPVTCINIYKVNCVDTIDDFS